jgi:hypothetical protein
METKKKCRELYERMDSAIADFVIAIRAVLPDNRNAVQFIGPDWKASITLEDDDGRVVLFHALSSFEIEQWGE